jgi:hypothetical protein
MPDGRLGCIDFGSCSHLTDEDVERSAEAERAYWDAPKRLRNACAVVCDLTAKQAADDVRMKFLEGFVEWAWEPVVHEGPFDFGDREYFRRGAALYGECLRRRYTRSRPANTWMTKCLYGFRAMMVHLDAQVDVGAIHRNETTVPQEDKA